MNFQLSLTEYSAKYRVSISTLRRRIKKNEVAYVQDAGKYMLPDLAFDELLGNDIAPPAKKVVNHVSDIAPPQKSSLDLNSRLLEPLGLDIDFEDGGKLEKLNVQTDSFAVSTNPELEELKKAYTKVLSEKEEQVLLLRQHIVDLQTLNKALENEIERLSEDSLFSSQTSFSKQIF